MEISDIRKSLEVYTVSELRVLAGLYSIRGVTKRRKADLIEELLKMGYRPAGGTLEKETKEKIRRYLAETVTSINLGELQDKGRLSIIPVFAADLAPESKTLYEELESSTIVIEELEDGGSVPELKLRKSSEGRTLLLDGEPLEGGKQNRVLSMTLLLDGKQDLTIPVTCIERDRWAFSSAQFVSSEFHSYYSSRSILSSSISSSLRSSHRYRSDQSGIWREIALSLQSTGTRSGTSSMSELFKKHENEISEAEEHFQISANQLGYQALIDGKPLAFELFGSHATFSKYWSRLLRGLVVETLRTPDIRTKPGRPSVVGMNELQTLVSKLLLEPYPAIGCGMDVRLTGPHTFGSLLIDGKAVEHWILHWN